MHHCWPWLPSVLAMPAAPVTAAPTVRAPSSASCCHTLVYIRRTRLFLSCFGVVAGAGCMAWGGLGSRCAFGSEPLVYIFGPYVCSVACGLGLFSTACFFWVSAFNQSLCVFTASSASASAPSFPSRSTCESTITHSASALPSCNHV